MILVVLDTNVLISGLLNAAGPPGKILDLILENRIQLAYDDRILGEYEDVVFRPELRIKPSSAKAVINHFELSGCFIEANPLSIEGFPNTDDVVFAEVFVTSKAIALVTGNARHFKPLKQQGFEVLSPTEFLTKFFP